MKKTLKNQLLELSKAHLNWKKKTKGFCYGTVILLMVAPSLVSSVSLAKTDVASHTPKATQAGERSGNLAINVAHSALDKAASDAKAAGLTVKADAQQNKGNAQGADAIAKLQKSISDDYTSQTTAIQKQTSDYKAAVTAYNKAEATYKQQLADLQKAIDNHEPGAPADAVGQGINFKSNQNPDAIVKATQFSGTGDGALVKANALKDGMEGLDTLTPSSVAGSPQFYTVGGAQNVFGLFLDAGQSVTVTYSNLKSLTVGKTAAAQMKVTYKNVTDKRMGLIVSKDPGNPFLYGVYAKGRIFVNQPHAVQQTDSFYDASGKAIPLQKINDAIPQFFAGSLNYSSAKTEDGGMPDNDDGYNAHESASFDHNKASGGPYGQTSISKVSGVPISGANATGDHWGVNPPNTNETWSATGLNDYIYNGALMNVTDWDTHSNHSWYGGFRLTPKDGQTSVSVTWSTTDANMWAVLNGKMPTNYVIPVPPIPPVKPTVTYHYDQATFQTNNTKTVTTVSGADLNGDLVNKQEVEDWDLSNEALPAGHEVIKSYADVDTLPEGFDLDETATQKLNPAYTIKHDEATNKVTISATPATLTAMNKDVNQVYQVPKVVLQGEVTKDGTSFANTFETQINNYSVDSNEVEIHTPDPKPEKSNENASGVTINGQGIDVNATNYYKLLWNLSGYKDAASTPEDIARGFYFVDVAPDCVNIDLKNLTMKDPQGHPILGITAKVYSSLQAAPANVQKVLKEANITPKGQFVFYSADDPQNFFTNVVQKGVNVELTQPMSLKPDASGTYQNTDYQIDFGNVYEGDTVQNDVVPPKVTKQVSVDGGKTWHESGVLPDNDSNYDYRLNNQFTANGDYTKITVSDALESSQWLDLSKAKVTDKDGNVIAGQFKVLNASGNDVTKDFNAHVFQKDGKKEALQIVFTPDKISDITALASKDDPDRLVTLTLSFKEVTLKGATGKELVNYLNKGKLTIPNVGELDTTSKTASGGNTKDEVTKSNETQVSPPQLAPMINKYVYDTGVGSSISLYDKGMIVPSYLSKMAQFTSLNLNKNKEVKAGDTVHYLIAAQSGNTSLMKNIVDTLPKGLSFAKNLNAKVFILKNEGHQGDEVTKDWSVETKGRTLTDTPKDPSQYYFAGSTTDSRVIVTLDAVADKDLPAGTYPNIATINNQDGGHKEDKATVHTTVIPAKEEPKNPIQAVANIFLPKTGDSKSIMTALGAWLVTIATVVGGVVLNERKRHTLAMTYHKIMRKIRK